MHASQATGGPEREREYAESVFVLYGTLPFRASRLFGNDAKRSVWELIMCFCKLSMFRL